MESFLKALPVVAKHPLALAALVVLVAAWLTKSLLVNKCNKLFDALKDLPKNQRLKAIELEYCTTSEVKLTAIQWLRARKMSLLFAGFAITLLALVVITALFSFRTLSNELTAGHKYVINIQSPIIQPINSNLSIHYPEVEKQSGGSSPSPVNSGEPPTNNPLSSKTAKQRVYRTQTVTSKSSPPSRLNENKSDTPNIEKAIEELHKPPPAYFNDAIKRLHAQPTKSGSVTNKTSN